MNAYFDSSAILRLVLGEPGKITDWKKYDRLVTSELAELECLRTLDRIRIRHNLVSGEIVKRRDVLYQLLETMEIVELNRPLLRRAAQTFPVELGTLDAIHLATAMTWQEEQELEMIMATHDRALGQAARAFGIPVEGT